MQPRLRDRMSAWRRTASRIITLRKEKSAYSDSRARGDLRPVSCHPPLGTGHGPSRTLADRRLDPRPDPVVVELDVARFERQSGEGTLGRFSRPPNSTAGAC